jgi:sugar-phosphatase
MHPICRINSDLLLFDLDGVLIDSTPCIVRHWQEWSKIHGLDLETVMAAAHGVRTIETMRTVAPQLDVAAEAARFTAHEEADTEGVSAIAGAGALMSSLPPDAWAIVTSAGAALAQARLRQAGLPFPQVLVSADDVVRGKPDPEPYITGAHCANCPPDRCVVIEDAPAGVAAGRSAGMRVIGVGATYSRNILLKAGATMVVDRISRLKITAGEADFRLAIEVEAV